MAEGFTDANGKFRPIQPSSHGSISSSIGLAKSDDEGVKHSDALSLIANKLGKLHGKRLAKNEIEKKEKEKFKKDLIESMNAVFNQNDISDYQKFHILREMMIRNEKFLDQDDYKVFGSRMGELHKEITEHPEKSKLPPHVISSSPDIVEKIQGYKENDPFEELPKPDKDDIAINKLAEERRRKIASSPAYSQDTYSGVKLESDNTLSPNAIAEIDAELNH